MAQEYLYDKVIKYVKGLIKQHGGESYYKLPSEKQLEIKLGVSNITVKNALKKLESDGLIIRHQGKGSFINSMTETHFSAFCNVAVCMIVPSTYFTNRILLGITDTCKKIGMMPSFFFSYNDKQLETSIINHVKKSNFDGLIIYPIDGDYVNSELVKLSLNNFPVVIIDREIQGIDVCFVSTNHYKQTYDAVTGLIADGKRNIMINLPFSIKISSTDSRHRAYIDAHIQNGIPIKKEYVRDNYIIEEGRTFVDSATLPPIGKNIAALSDEYYRYFKEYPDIDAVITINGMCFIAIIAAAKRLYDETGRKIGIRVFDDDSDILPSVCSVPYESLVQKGFEIGKAASEQIYNILTGQEIEKRILL